MMYGYVAPVFWMFIEGNQYRYQNLKVKIYFYFQLIIPIRNIVLAWAEFKINKFVLLRF